MILPCLAAMVVRIGKDYLELDSTEDATASRIWLNSKLVVTTQARPNFN